MGDGYHFALHANCIPVRGASESLICDLGRGECLPIENGLLDILEHNACSSMTVGELMAFYNHKCDAGIAALFSYLEGRGYGFFTDMPECFPPMSLQWDSPYPLTNAVLEVQDWELAGAALSDLVGIGCQSIALIFSESIPLHIIEQEFIAKIKHSQTSCVSVYVPYNKEFSAECVREFLVRNQIVGKLVFIGDNGFKDSNIVGALPTLFQSRVQFVSSNRLNLNNYIEIYINKNFVINTVSFSEAQRHNLALNRRVCIDGRGRIKNDLSHRASFGQLGRDVLVEVVRSGAFQQKWGLSKDMVAVCCDCQYRYMCVDFADIEHDGARWRRVSPCRFDPYTNSWSSP